ncbi:MAG: PIN domain-containing protein [Candidatus Poribacteria bacterium]
MGTRITLDAHTLIWYIHKPSRNNLSAKALSIIREATVNGIIYVPTIILLEIIRLIEKKKYPIPFKDLLAHISLHRAFEIVSLTSEIVEISAQLNHWDIHDRVIIATAIYTDTELVSSDAEITQIYNRVIW